MWKIGNVEIKNPIGETPGNNAAPPLSLLKKPQNKNNHENQAEVKENGGRLAEEEARCALYTLTSVLRDAESHLNSLTVESDFI